MMNSANRMATLAAACGLALLSIPALAWQPAEAVSAEAVALPDRAAIAQKLGVTTFTLHTLEPVRNDLGGVEIALPDGDRPLDLYLWPHSVRAPQHRLLICRGAGDLVEVDPPAAATYRGLVEREGASRIAATLRDGRLDAMILLDGHAERPDRVLFIQPLSAIIPDAPPAVHAVYSAADTAAHPGLCGGGIIPPGRPGRGPGDGGGDGDGPLVADLATDADYQYFQENGGSEANTIADVETIINNVSLVYESEVDVRVRSSTIIVRTTDWPYVGGGTPEELLNEFRDHWNGEHYDIGRAAAHLSTGLDLPGTGVIGMAWLGVVCDHFASPRDSHDYAYNVSRFTMNMNHRTAVHAHELGHNFSARHCDESPHVCSPCAIMCSHVGGCGTSLTLGCNAAEIADFAATRACLVSTPRLARRRQTEVIDLTLEGWNLRLWSLPGRRLNNRGQVLLLGTPAGGGVPRQTFVWRDGVHIRLQSSPGYGVTEGRAIADDGRIVGFMAFGGNLHATVWESAASAPAIYYHEDQDPRIQEPHRNVFSAVSDAGLLDPPHIVGQRGGVTGQATRAVGHCRISHPPPPVEFPCYADMGRVNSFRHRVYDVNSSGVAVGSENQGVFEGDRPVRWRGTTAEILRDSADTAVAINNRGQILLQSGRFWENGQVGPGFEQHGGNRKAFTMNNHGTVLGVTGAGGGNLVIWQDGLIVAYVNDLLPHGSPWSIPAGPTTGDINDDGWIVAETNEGPYGAILVIPGCYADCDENGQLDFFDFLCFQNEFLAGDPYADCDQNGVLDFFDFLCFQNEFLAGCP